MTDTRGGCLLFIIWAVIASAIIAWLVPIAYVTFFAIFGGD